MKLLRCLVSAAVIALVPGWAYAQFPSWSSEQQAVWDLVAQSWADEVAENGRWPAQYVHDNVVDWGDRQPAPRGIDKITEWARFEEANGRTLFYEVTPAAIVVVDDTAVVHYHLMMVSEDEEGEQETSVRGLVETLVRQNRAWKYVSLSGFEPKFGDDD